MTATDPEPAEETWTYAGVRVLDGKRQHAWLDPAGEELLFSRTGYSTSANFAVPAGRIRFWRFSAFETSIGESCFAYSSSRFRSTMIWRFFPPNG